MEEVEEEERNFKKTLRGRDKEKAKRINSYTPLQDPRRLGS